MTCQKLNKGNINLPLFGLLSKMHSLGRLTLQDMYASLINSQDFRTSLKSNLLKGKNEAYLSMLASSL